MKIAMIGHKRIPSREGGVEVVVGELATRMVQLGHDVTCYNRWDDRKVPMATEYEGVHIVPVPTSPKQSLNAFLYSVLASFKALPKKYDVIHYHAEGPCAMTWLPKLFGIPVVATIHGLDWQRSKWGGFASRYIKFGERNAVTFADQVIVLSRENQRYFKELYQRDTIHLENGVSIHERREPKIIREKWGLEYESYILFLARLVPEKGLHYLIEAYKRLNTDKRLVIAGPLTGTDYVKSIRAAAAEDSRIIMTDFVQGEVFEELMGNCFLYVLPSDVEGMPISLLEALSYGVRCLVSDIDENKETAQDYSSYFKKSSIDDLQHKLETILSDRNDFDRAKQTAFIKRSYDWDHVTAETLRIYETAIYANHSLVKRLSLSKAEARRQYLQTSIQELEIRRSRSESALLSAIAQHKELDHADVQFFNRYTSEIEVLREQLTQLR